MEHISHSHAKEIINKRITPLQNPFKDVLNSKTKNPEYTLSKFLSVLSLEQLQKSNTFSNNCKQPQKCYAISTTLTFVVHKYNYG